MLLRLLIPMNFGESRASVMNIFPANIQDAATSVKSSEDIIDLPSESSLSANYSENISSPENSYTYDTKTGTNENDVESAIESTEGVGEFPDWRQILKYIWIIGVAAVSLCLLIFNIRFAGKLKRSRSNTQIADCPPAVYCRLYWNTK